jgi:hypothetical protein
MLPGDLLLTRSEHWTSWLIRLGAALMGKPNMRNHVIVVSHRDEAGTLWGIEGRPGGVGWRALDDELTARWTLSNADQPKTDAQRELVVKGAVSLLGTKYDWTAIVLDTAMALRIDHLWKLERWGNVEGVPAQIVCSAMADYVYEKAGLAHPNTGYRTTTPADWDEFITLRKWETNTFP